jgi:hypothetical protein
MYLEDVICRCTRQTVEVPRRELFSGLDYVQQVVRYALALGHCNLQSDPAGGHKLSWDTLL